MRGVREMVFTQRRVRLLGFVTLMAAATVGGAFGSSSAGTTVKAVTSAALRTKIVVDARGFTLYHMTSEKKGSVACTSTCRKIWPPLLVAGSAKPVAGPGLSATKLGMVKRPDGGVQVTYNGYALYHYSGDKAAGKANGQGVEDLWYALTPAGTVTKAVVKTASTSSGGGNTSATGGSGTGSGGSGSGSSGSGGTGGSAGGGGDTGACTAGQTIPQGIYAGDGDDDNTGGVDDQDGCL
jgi:predicted lipoprotein with Yx(FWY)xxD motif